MLNADEQAVFEILQAASAPLGWYAVALRLGMRGAIVERRLPEVLESLVAHGLVERSGPPARRRYQVRSDQQPPREIIERSA